MADNKLAENAGWDKSILAIELQHLLTLDDSFDVTVTGFEIPEIDLILRDASSSTSKEDAPPDEVAGPAITQPGDLWTLGKHRILCANALQESSYKTLLAGRRAALQNL